MRYGNNDGEAQAIAMPWLFDFPSTFAKQELSDIPGFGRASRVYGNIAVARDQGDLATMSTARTVTVAEPPPDPEPAPFPDDEPFDSLAGLDGLLSAAGFASPPPGFDSPPDDAPPGLAGPLVRCALRP